MRIERRPPGPRGIFGTSRLLFLRRHPHSFLSLARKYGDLVYFKIGVRDVFFVSRPHLIEQILRDHYAYFEKDWGPRRGHSMFKNGLMTSEGVEHRDQRQELGRLFARPAVDRQRPVVTAVIDAWSRRQRDGSRVDVFQELSELSSEIATRALFGCSVDAEALRSAMTTIGRGFRRWMFPYAHLLRLRPTARPPVAAIVDEVKRKATGEGLLAPLVDAGGAGLDAQIATFLVTGQETIRIATSWALFHLAADPSSRERLVAERASDEEPRTRFAEAVLLESMRLHPPQWMIGRRTIADYALDGYDVPRGALVLVCPYTLHRDERYFADADRFLPDRWEAAPAVRSTYIPFGAGPRRCIGEAFATVVGTMVLSSIARQWAFDFESPARIRYDARLTLAPRAMPARIRAVRPPVIAGC